MNTLEINNSNKLIYNKTDDLDELIYTFDANKYKTILDKLIYSFYENIDDNNFELLNKINYFIGILCMCTFLIEKIPDFNFILNKLMEIKKNLKKVINLQKIKIYFLIHLLNA